MYVRSPAFDTAVRNSHTVINRADVLLNGVVVASGLPVTAGSVNVDSTAATRRRGQITVVDATGALIPLLSSSTLSPYGRELRLWRGIQYPDGTTEMLPVGTLRIGSSEAADNSGQVINVLAYDRARTIARARFETPYQIQAGTNYGTAIQTLLSTQMSGLTFNFVTVTNTTPLLVFDQQVDPWASAQSMATSIGCDLFFDPLGVCVLRLTPNPATANIDWDYSGGSNSMLMPPVDWTMTDDPGYNGIVVDGEPPGLPPVHSVVYDTNPQSPTYSLGTYGKVPYFLRSQFVTTQAQADAAAASLLIQERGGTEQAKFSAIPHPAHEGGDIVKVADAALGISDNFVIESFTMPLTAEGTATFTCKKRRTS